jgi:hypothetical protein
LEPRHQLRFAVNGITAGGALKVGPLGIDDRQRGEVFVGDYVKVCGLRRAALEDWAISEWRSTVAECRHCF